MGFSVAGAFNKSVFNKSSYAAAVGQTDLFGDNGYAVIRITPDTKRVGAEQESPYILGVIKEGVEFSVQANCPFFGSANISTFLASLPVL